ncbi:hypothetical protein EMCG_06889 [[Emmonsia] crescens]|uniref:Kelch repeat-containing protein n=1 Tax=[Emmonsia] crescens TaxID=73230 RepID=A0A0G2IAA9_9EURO|nr:hypothetical protein EMCG_06889 [Emmonsia crescens UAMH 3008]
MAPLWIIAATILPALLKGATLQKPHGEVNKTICSWFMLRANIIRDTIYLDGGHMAWQRGYSDGSYGEITGTNLADGFAFTLNLSVPFDITKTHWTDFFGSLSTTSGAVNNIAPSYSSGTMFANDYKYYLYGGLIQATDANSPPVANKVLAYERDQYGPSRIRWRPGFLFEDTNNGVTRYVTHGAGVSVPSENKGFYFSGKRGVNWGEISNPVPVANVTANTLISLDMSQMRSPEWANSTFPDHIAGRAAGELVWIPVSASGALIAIGGVPYPQDISDTPAENIMRDKRENNRTGPEFMRSVPVYDIDNQKWYMQNTTGEHPPTLAHFCSVVAAAQDGSSYNIYIYGGYSGSDSLDFPYNHAYILSVPSFIWIRAYDGDRELGRRSHKCIKPYPDKMFVLGGMARAAIDRIDTVRVFNLNTLRFQNTYHPEDWSEYEVPDLVTAKIGGNAKGGATALEPLSWGHDDLRDLFRTKYTKPIKTYYPYPLHKSSAPNPTKPRESNDRGGGGGGGLPKWVAPVLGVVLGLIFVTGLAVLWLLWRRRRDRTYATSEGVISDNRKRIMGWMYGMGLPTQKTNMTMASTEIGINDKHTSTTAFSEVGDSVTAPPPHLGVVYSDPKAQEAGGVQVHEMQAGHVSAPLELPTEYNVAPTSPRTRVVSNASTFRSPVSPEPPSPQPNPNFPPSQPTHVRNNSSLSSAAINLSTSNAPTVEEQGSQRRGYVSGFTEDFPSPEPESSDRTGRPL